MKRPHGKSKRVYVAGPYRAPSETGCKANIDRAKEAAIRLCVGGFFPMTPHLNTALFDFDERLANVPAEFWLDNYKDLVLDCDMVLVLGNSEGTAAEVKVAQHYGIPVYFSLNELFDNEVGAA